MTPDERHDLRLRALKVLGIPVLTHREACQHDHEEYARELDMNGLCIRSRGKVFTRWQPDLDLVQAIRVALAVAKMPHHPGVPTLSWEFCDGGFVVKAWLGICGVGAVINVEPAEALLRAALAAWEKLRERVPEHCGVRRGSDLR